VFKQVLDGPCGSPSRNKIRHVENGPFENPSTNQKGIPRKSIEQIDFELIPCQIEENQRKK